MRKPILSLLIAVVFWPADFLSAPSVLIGLGIAATAAAASGKPPLQTSRQSTAPGHSTGGTIKGKVLLDGVPSGEIKVSVTPVRQLGAGASFNAMLARSEGEETDDDGSFAIDGLDPGGYAISVEAPGYIVTSGLTDEDGKPIYYRPGDQVTIRMIKGGVITGKVTDSFGHPVVEIPIHALLLLDDKGRPARANAKVFGSPDAAATDDRGIYRLYTLEPGTYLVSTAGSEQFRSTPFVHESPVYHPSGTVDVAAHVTVQAGQETSGVDISYSSMPGHSVSGHLAGQFATGGVMSIAVVILTHLRSGVPQAEAISAGDSHPFHIEGAPDGEYLLTAISYSFGKDLTVSAPRRVIVKGADVTGIDLTLGPITAISGRVAIQGFKQDDPKSACKAGITRQIEDIIIAPHPSEKSKASEQIPMVLDLTESSSRYVTSPDSKGEFTVQLPSGGSYHIETELLDNDLFLSSVTLPPESAAPRVAGGSDAAAPRVAAGSDAASSQPARNGKDASGGIVVKNSERVTGVIVNVSQGGALFSGRVVPSGQGAAVPERLRLYLVPVEKDAADNTLRYYEAATRRDGSFEIKHIAPGQYYVVTRIMSQEEWDEVNPRPVWWGSASRQKLRKEAETLNSTIELKPCQQLKGFAAPLAAAGTKPATGQ